jgi:NAD(P)-dependent dehydrogenase (short-subunit alcohol dehydrogenase family)
MLLENKSAVIHGGGGAIGAAGARAFAGEGQGSFSPVARSVGRRMVDRGSGVILTIAAGPPEARAYIGFGRACGAIEGLWRGLAAELGPRDVRVVCVGFPGYAGRRSAIQAAR